MKDVNSHIFYKAKFEIQALVEVDLLWKVVDSIRRWITFKLNYKKPRHVITQSKQQWSYFKKGGKLYDLERLNRVYAESVYYQQEDDPAAVCWACRIIEKPEPESGWQRMGRGFIKSIKGVGNGLKEFFIWLVAAIPYLLLIGAIGAGIFLIIWGSVRRGRKKRAAKKTEE